MADTQPAPDVEDPATEKAAPPPPVLGREFYEAAFLLSMWSILVVNEGVIRFVGTGQPRAPDLFASSNPNRFAGAFLGALFEVIFGLFGLAVGLLAAILGYFNKQLLLACIGTQNILGWYTFISYVFVIPSYRISKIDGVDTNLNLTEGAAKFVGVLGILTSAAWCLALQGGQFVFMARLMAYGDNTDFLKQRTGAKMRAIFWNANLALSGLWATIQACIVIAGAGGGKTGDPFNAPPNVGRLPVYLLLTGLLMLLWPLGGIALTFTGNAATIRHYAGVSFIVFLWIHVHYTIGQLGFLGGAMPAAGAGMHNHLVMMVCFLGPYFMIKKTQETAEES